MEFVVRLQTLVGRPILAARRLKAVKFHDMGDRCYQDMVDTWDGSGGGISPEPSIAKSGGPERRGGGKGAPWRGAADPCPRAPFWHRTASMDGSGEIPLVSSEAVYSNRS